MKIPIYFLGTGQAVPTIKRNHTSILLSYKNENIMVDCGEGTQRQIRKMKINPCSLTRILITHWHGDHILGLPGLFQTLALNGYNKKLHVYGPYGTKKYLSAILNMFVFVGKLDIEIHEIDEGKIIDEKEFYIESKRMKHSTYCLAYSFVEKDKIRIDKGKMRKLKIKQGKELGKIKQGKDITINGKKIKFSQITYKEKGKKITFILDTVFNENMIKISKNSDLLICESTYGKDDKEKAREHLHLTAEQAALTAKKAKCNQLILLHTSQRYENKENILLNEAKKIFKNTKLVEDLDVIEI
jgi:ribonuclease Z